MTGAWEDPNVRNFIWRLKDEGFEHIRLSVNSRKTLFLSVQCQKVKTYEYGSSRMYAAEAVWDGEYCCASANSLEEDDEMIRRLKETAGIFGSREFPDKIRESRDYRGQRWRTIEKEEIAECLRYAEREALSCEKTDFVERCEYQQYEETITLLDEDLNYLADDDGDCTFTIRVSARDGDSVSAATKLAVVDIKEREEFLRTVQDLARRAAKHARFGLHGEKLLSGSYPIVLENCVMAELIGHFLPIFYAENIRQNSSALTGKEKKQAGCRLLRIEEDPFSVKGTRRRRIDDEGMPVSGKILIKEGVFEASLYNKKSAAEAGCKSTGNGFKPDAAADIGTGVTNVILSSEKDVFAGKEMIRASEGGVYITKVEGMFAGADTESGDFSLLASGNRIENGQVCTAVRQFTISGNICELWKDIEMIGDDPVYRMTGAACVVSPTVRVKSLMVSGE